MKVRKDGWILDDVTQTWNPPKKQDDKEEAIPTPLEELIPAPPEPKAPTRWVTRNDPWMQRWFKIN